ncbi:hypothetical protein V2I01_03180 [Micromonospora sp. BRA006-A]|nr:hypothetical protein [Micromonospora sp. BRA006-A]
MRAGQPGHHPAVHAGRPHRRRRRTGGHADLDRRHRRPGRHRVRADAHRGAGGTTVTSTTRHVAYDLRPGTAYLDRAGLDAAGNRSAASAPRPRPPAPADRRSLRWAATRAGHHLLRDDRPVRRR